MTESFDTSKLLRIAQAFNERTERTVAHQTQSIRAGTVTDVNQNMSVRLASVLLDGETTPMEVKFLGETGPGLGARVHVLLSGGDMTIMAGLPLALFDPGLPPIPPVPIQTSSNTDRIHSLDFWGHSYIDTLGRTDMAGYQIANQVFSALGISWPHARNYGVGGDSIFGGWKRIFRTARPVQDNSGDIAWQAKFGPQALLYGANDLGDHTNPKFDNSRFLNEWANCYRGAISWFRAGAIYTPDYIFGATGDPFDPTEPYPASSLGFSGGTNVGTQVIWDTLLFPGGKAGVTYTGTWTKTTSLNYASVGRNAWQTTATTGATVTIHLPPNFPGTPVTLYFGAEVGQTGSTNATITHSGTTPASPIALVTNDRVRTPSTYQGETPVPSVYPVRIIDIPAGDKSTSQTIVVNAGTLAAGHKLTFLGWSIEATHPPLIAIANIPPVLSWASSGYNTNGLAGNSNGTVLDSAGTVMGRWASYPQANGIQPASTTLTGAVTTGATTITVASSPSFLPLPFLVKIPRGAAAPSGLSDPTSETMTVTARSGTTFTVTRGAVPMVHDNGQAVTFMPSPRVGTQAGDNWCRNSYNPMLSTIAAEFAPAGTVVVVDLALVVDGTRFPEAYSPNDLGGSDAIHPNPLGKAAIVKAFLTAMNRVPLDSLYLQSPFSPDDLVESAAMLGEPS